MADPCAGGPIGGDSGAEAIIRQVRTMIGEQTAPELLRKAHVVEGAELRLLKAHEICRVLSNYISLEGKRLLDVGAGTGEIAQYLQSIGCHVAPVS